jgi:DNA-binding XRE family transcriptional regulator
MTQEQVADQIQVTKSFISFLENGRMSPSLHIAFKLADLYNVEIDETGKVYKAFQKMLKKIPVNDAYEIASIFEVEFDSNGLFKEDSI